ncbi:hypothetical protein BC833DRAFT_613086 [Globomyces pollinis-pini]|nr:hypothetical protein BC833DRAFT_613086 [Globomyces pollinis-pini]
MTFINPHFNQQELANILVTDPPGDGNCMAYALSISLYGIKDRYQEIKNAMSEEVANNMEYYTKYGWFKHELEDAARNIKVDRLWFSSCYGLFFANAYKCILCIHSQSCSENKPKGHAYTFYPFRYSDSKMEEFNIYHIAWGSIHVANHFISLNFDKIQTKIPNDVFSWSCFHKIQSSNGNEKNITYVQSSLKMIKSYIDHLPSVKKIREDMGIQDYDWMNDGDLLDGIQAEKNHYMDSINGINEDNCINDHVISEVYPLKYNQILKNLKTRKIVYLKKIK